MKIWYQSFLNKEVAPWYWARLEVFLKENSKKGVEVLLKGMYPHDSYAHSLVELRCSREAVAASINAGKEGFDGYLMGHFQDSGLYEARGAAKIPVIGLGESAMLYACQYGQNIGIITINSRFIPGHIHQIKKYGLQDRIKSVHAIEFQPGEILKAFESSEILERVVKRFTNQAEPMVRSGIDVIIPAGGIPMLLFSEINDFKVLSAPVLNGLPVALRMTELAVEMDKKFGIKVSRNSDFMEPPEEVIEEFLQNPKI